MFENLSIFIPTYNRKERLLNMLCSIVSQPLGTEVSITVLNNHSDYDVEKAIKECLGVENSKKVCVINNRSNVGLSMNIALPFYYCKTKWLWILSDDDKTTEDSLKIIKSDMESFSDYTCIKYSLDGFSSHNDETMTSLEQLVNYYWEKDKDQGEFIFISNNLFNMEKIEPFIGSIISYSYNAVAGILPYVYSLDSGGHKVMMRSKSIVSYLLPQKGSEWNYIDITTRLITLIDYPFKSDGKVVRSLMDRMNHFSFYSYMEGLIQLDDKEKTRLFISKTFPLLFRNGILRRMVYRFIYYNYLLFGLNTIPFVKPLDLFICKCIRKFYLLLKGT